jgi:hypothetical protein
MGEKSKNIGDQGEAIVGNFLEIIGWKPFQKGVEIDCIHKKKHDKETHGIDFLFSYICPLHANTLENISISSKFSEDPYPISETTNYKGLKSVFKAHFSDLATTIECFKKSHERQAVNKEFIGVKKSKESGVLFWLNDHPSNTNVGVISYLSKVRVDTKLVFDAIHIIDNNRINEITDALKFVKSENKPDSEITFDYFNTGLNVSIQNRKTNGKILPIQYLSSQILPLRIEKEDGQKILQLISFENYSIDSFRRIIGLAQSYVLNYQLQTIVSFPDFNPTQEITNEIERVKTSFLDMPFSDKIKVNCFRPNHRNYDS